MISAPALSRAVRAWLGPTWHLVRDARRRRQELDVWRDYLAFRRRYGRLFREVVDQPGRGRTVLIVSLSDRIYQVKLEGFLAKVLQARGYSPAILTDRGARWAHRYFRAYGIRRYYYLDDFAVDTSEEAARAASEFLAGPVNVQTFKALRFRGAEVGRYALASVSRTLYEGAVELDQPLVRAHLAEMLPRAMRNVLAAERLLDAVQPDLLLFNEKGYVTFGGICDAALVRNLNVVQFVQSIHGDDSLSFKRYTADTRRFHPQSLSDETWERVREMPWADEQDQQLTAEFRQRYEGPGFLGRRTQGIPAIRGSAAVRQQLGLVPKRKVAVVFSHILWDANMFYGDDLFQDQEEWFIETIRAACQNDHLDWLIKLHPANVWKMKREQFGELGEKASIRRHFGQLPAHVKLLEPDVDVNPFDLFELADYGITIRGTIGIEMPCFGVPVLTAGTGRYSGRGFTVDPCTRHEYLHTLARLHELPRLNQWQTLLAKKHAYGLFVLRPWRMQSLRTLYTPMQAGGHPLEQNLEIGIRCARDLAAAPDLRRLADWLLDPRPLDYLERVPAASSGRRGTRAAGPPRGGEDADGSPAHPAVSAPSPPASSRTGATP